MAELINQFEQALLSLDRLEIRNLLERSGDDWTPVERIEKLVVPALKRIGDGWEQGTVALSQVYMSGRICEELVDAMLLPEDLSRKGNPRMAIAVLDDYHMLGKRIVYSTLRASGFSLLDYGHVDVDSLVHRVKEENIQILLISTLMLSSALRVKEVSEKLKSSAEVKIIVGGAPFRFDSQLWREVGADAMCKTASEAVPAIERIMGGML